MTNAPTRPAATRHARGLAQLAPTAVGGITYLYGRAAGFPDWVSRYERSEMAELFTAEEWARLSAGETVVQKNVRWSDMVAAARAAA